MNYHTSREAGVYTVEVQHGKEGYLRTCLHTCFTKISSSNAKDGEESSASNPPKNESSLPVVEREEIKFSTKDEIGRGAFHVVFKGE